MNESIRNEISRRMWLRVGRITTGLHGRIGGLFDVRESAGIPRRAGVAIF